MQPLEHYTKRRKDDLSPSPSAGGSARHDYAIPVMKYWGTACAYCGRDLADGYESWLALSVDHVVPGCVLGAWGADRGNWIRSRANLVPCCRACNEFLNGYRVKAEAPVTEEAFLALRDRVLEEKREMALLRHQQEAAWFEQWRPTVSREA